MQGICIVKFSGFKRAKDRKKRIILILNKPKNPFSLTRNPKFENSNTVIGVGDECRRGITTMSSGGFSPINLFKMYVEDLSLQESGDYLTFKDF